MGERLKGRVAVVTGSGQGIGRSIAKALAQEGAKIITNNRRPGTEGGDAETTAREIRQAGGEAIPAFADISNFGSAEKLIRTAVDNFGRIDILVNGAGADSPRMVWNLAEEDWDKCVNSYLKGSFNCTRHACGFMRQQRWGRIINLTSEAYIGTVGHANYGAAKAGLVGFTYAVAREMGRYGVTCNAFAPEAATRFTQAPEIIEGFKKRYEAGLISKERLDELLNIPSPDCIAPFVIYLSTEEAWNTNGHVFRVAGGEVSLYSEPVRMKSIFKDYEKDEPWSVNELSLHFPKTLGMDLINPAPPEQEK